MTMSTVVKGLGKSSVSIACGSRPLPLASPHFSRLTIADLVVLCNLLSCPGQLMLKESPMFGIRFIKAQPTTYLMKYRAGSVTREGAGISGFYYAPVTSLVAIPIGSRDAAFIFQQIANDFQALTIQGHITYRISEPRKAASMLNFTLKADGKTYESDDPEKLSQRILGNVEVLAQQAVKELPLKEGLRASDRIAELIAAGLRGRADIASLGIEILG